MTVDVAVNLLWCVPGKVGGSEQYLTRQLDGLGAETTEFAPTIYCLPSFVDAHPELTARFAAVTASIDGTDRARRVLTEHTWLARRTKSADLVHHGGGTAPSRGGRPIVLTVHDLQYETFPHYTSATKLRYLRTMMPRSVARAAVVAVPTEYVRGTVIGRFGLDPERVVVVPHGVEPDLGERARSEQVLRRDYGLGDGRVLVLPAITHPHKGHRFLLDVLARHWPDPALRLVFLGGPGAADADIRREVARRGLADRVVFAGRVDDADRDGLIRIADALVFPSEYEGFGAPVVEAMALDTPVICSDQPALSEVVADAGLVLALDHEAWADALDLVARDGDEMRAAGRRRAQDFTARTSGTGLAAAYRRALEVTG
ncbi:glycosyltransferase family 4 protein [Ilumatobacter nonamiensis]|uniref:glycosyltransferase family 4 protein n=1 Tax=Ilumatobacter nonamiensis TaxID=467093 RepID=UPI00034BE50C|nr:glycosyltransferase family 1 protein [Ilumatobacter nonamiensis]